MRKAWPAPDVRARRHDLPRPTRPPSGFRWERAALTRNSRRHYLAGNSGMMAFCDCGDGRGDDGDGDGDGGGAVQPSQGDDSALTFQREPHLFSDNLTFLITTSSFQRQPHLFNDNFIFTSDNFIFSSYNFNFLT